MVKAYHFKWFKFCMTICLKKLKLTWKTTTQKAFAQQVLIIRIFALCATAFSSSLIKYNCQCHCIKLCSPPSENPEHWHCSHNGLGHHLCGFPAHPNHCCRLASNLFINMCIYIYIYIYYIYHLKPIYFLANFSLSVKVCWGEGQWIFCQFFSLCWGEGQWIFQNCRYLSL